MPKSFPTSVCSGYFEFIPIDSSYNSTLSYSFTGEACPTIEVVTLIGLERVECIAQHIKKLIANKIELYGAKSSKIKFPDSTLLFKSKENPQIIISCDARTYKGLGRKVAQDRYKSQFYFPERSIDNVDNYRMYVKQGANEILNSPTPIEI